MEKIVHGVSVFCGAVIGFMYGETTGLLIALVALMAFDYITGILKGFVKKKLSSNFGFKGICKKIVILLLVSVAHMIDVYVLGGDRSVIMTVTACFYIGNEGLSILENAIAIGLKVPNKLKNALKQIIEADEDDENDKEDKDGKRK